MNACDAIMNAGGHRWLDWNEKQRGTQVRSRKRYPTPLGDNVVLLGNVVVYYRIGLDDSLTKTKSFSIATPLEIKNSHSSKLSSFSEPLL